MSVNVPVNEKLKERDINAKLQLYGMYEAFAHGKIPTNKQVDVAMNTALEWSPFTNPPKTLSSDGQTLVNDLHDVVEQTKLLLLTKNEGNLMQDFVWQTKTIGTGDAKKPNVPVNKDMATKQGNEALEGLRTLGQLLITNGQFRKLLKDVSVLLRDMAGDAASNTAKQVKPSDDDLAQIDQPAEDNTWHDAPDFSKDKLRSKVPFQKQEVKEEAKQISEDAQKDADKGGKEGGKAGAETGAVEAKKKASERMTAEQKEKARQYRERSRNYFKGKMPKERREQFIWRLKKMVVEIQSHQDYQKAIETLLRLAEEYGGHGKNLHAQGTDSAKGAHDQQPLKAAETDLKILLQRFANSTSFEDFTDSINQIYKDAEKDDELKGWFKDLNRYIRRCLQQEGFILDDESNEEGSRLYEKGRFLTRERYRDHFDHVVDEAKFMAEQFEQDPQNKAFAQSMNKLFNHLGHDANGKQEFKPHLLKDLTDVFIPAFFENVRYVPIPRIEFSDNMIDAVVENLVLEGDNLAPNMFEFGSDNYFRWGRRGNKSGNKNKVMLSVSGIQMDLRDVAYYVKKKEGFPSITDKGVMDIYMGGSGLSFKVAMETTDKHHDSLGQDHFYKINKVDVDIQNMKIKVKQSNHKLLFTLFKPFALKVMRPVIQKVVEKQVRDAVRKSDAFLYKVKKEADRAAEEVRNNPDRENVQNIYQRYFNAMQREITRGKEKKEEAKQKSGQVNVAITKEESMFKDISLPGGISTKATEYKQLAAKGDKWETPVFTIGSASETTNIEKPAPPQRKPHSSRQGGVREPGQTSRSTEPATLDALNKTNGRT